MASSVPAGWASSPPHGSRSWGHEVWCVDIDPAGSPPAAGEVPIHEPGLGELIARRGGRLHFDDGARAGAGARAPAVRLRRRRRPTYSGDADLRAVKAVIGELRKPVRARDRDEEHRARRDGAHPPPARRAGQGRPRLRLQPGVPAEGSAVGDFCIRTGSSSATRPRGAATRSCELYGPLDAPDRAHRRRRRGDGQARLERLPGDQDLLHQRDRQRLRGDRRGRDRGRTGDGLGPRIGRELPATRGSDTGAHVSRRMSPPSSSSPATPATTSSC